MKISDIPQFPIARYEANVAWGHIEEWLESQMAEIIGYLGLNLDPDFQRGHVWSEDKQIAYIEFCLKGGQYSRTILFNHKGWMTDFVGEMVLVDGKQRLEAVRKFIRNELPVFGGNKLNDFDYPDRLLRSQHLLIGVNNLPTRKLVLDWYLQLNSGGVVHTPEEIEKVKKLLALEPAT